MGGGVLAAAQSLRQFAHVHVRAWRAAARLQAHHARPHRQIVVLCGRQAGPGAHRPASRQYQSTGPAALRRLDGAACQHVGRAEPAGLPEPLMRQVAQVWRLAALEPLARPPGGSRLQSSQSCPGNACAAAPQRPPGSTGSPARRAPAQPERSDKRARETPDPRRRPCPARCVSPVQSNPSRASPQFTRRRIASPHRARSRVCDRSYWHTVFCPAH